MRIGVLVADDDPSVLEMLRTLVGMETDMHVVAAVEDTDACIRAAAEIRPTVALIDANMPAGGGTRACREIRRSSPETSTLIYSGSQDLPHVMAMLREGAVGYVVKGTAPRLLLEAIRRASRGEGTLPTEVASAVLAELRRRPDQDVEEHFGPILDEIIRERKITIVLQPIVEIATGRTVGAEALSRFEKEGPAIWFDRARALGRGVELELLAVELALEQLPHVGDGFLDINVLPDTVTDPRLYEMLSDQPGESVMLEITEHAPVESSASLHRALAEIRSLGVRIAADDVGAGYANFQQLLHLAPECLKLDRALVKEIDLVPTKQLMATALKDFARGIGSIVIAEGIEREEEVAALKKLGIRLGQGFYLGHPEPPTLAGNGATTPRDTAG